MSTEQLVQLISNVGFPIVVAGYLLWKIEPALSGLTTAVNKLTERLDR